MAILKRNADGKIITRDGKPSCECCCTHVDCNGLWGPGYDTLPSRVHVVSSNRPSRVASNLPANRDGKCGYYMRGDLEYGYITYWNANPADPVFPPGTSSPGSRCGWIMLQSVYSAFVWSTKLGPWSDGPAGKYYSSVFVTESSADGGLSYVTADPPLLMATVTLL